jgi:nitroreductase
VLAVKIAAMNNQAVARNNLMSEFTSKDIQTGSPYSDDQLNKSFHEIVRKRRSMRAFTSDPVPRKLIEEVLNDAQWAPSNGNTQPWHVHIVSGETRDRLSAALFDAVKAGKFSLDFSFSTKAFVSPYLERYEEQGKLQYEAEGVARDDANGRAVLAMRNYSFFNAPHVALLFMPSIGDSVRVAADVGMYVQTFLLSLVAKGLGGVPQTSIGMVADTVREVLGIPNELKLLCAISFGHPADSQLNKKLIGRVPLCESVKFYD